MRMSGCNTCILKCTYTVHSQNIVGVVKLKVNLNRDGIIKRLSKTNKYYNYIKKY